MIGPLDQAQSSGASVSIAAVTRAFGQVRAVDGVSLEVKSGEFLSLLGPSGSGKTTILMMVAGFETPDSGTISIGNRDITHVAANRRDVGMVFQRYALFPHMSVADNIGFPLRMRRLPKAEVAARVGQALALVRLEGYGDRLPAQLSGGQQQRVALARAIVFQPPVLLMDEPLAALDKKLRQAMQLELRRLQQKLGLTVLYVTHDQEEALTMSDRVAVLNEGRLEQVGRPEELYEAPATPFVADFIGETNFLPGAVVSSQGDLRSVRLASGDVAEGRAAGAPSAAGAAVQMAIRPERMQLAASGTGIPGLVTDRVYAGAIVTHVVRLDSQHDVMVRLAIGAGEAEEIGIGRRVFVSWRAADARVYALPGRGR